MLITGGSLGIGKSLAKQYLQNGAKVTIVARNKANLDAAVHELSVNSDCQIRSASADCTDEQAFNIVVEEAC